MLPSQGSSDSSIAKQVIWGGGCSWTTSCNNAVEALLQGVVKLPPPAQMTCYPHRGYGPLLTRSVDCFGKTR